LQTRTSPATRIREVEIELEACREENKLLRAKLGTAAWRIDASIAEAFVHELIGGERTRGSAAYDLEAPNGMRIEIKFSNLNKAMPNSVMRRWVWGHVLGRNNAKVFDRLILLGPHDPQFRQQMKDPNSKWVIFDVPFNEVASLAEKDGMIWIGTHPTKFGKRPTHRRLVCEYQVTQNELRKRYRRMS